MWLRYKHIRWRLVLFGSIKGSGIAVLMWVALVLLYGISLAIAAQGRPNPEHIGRFGEYGVWVIPVLTIVVTRFVAAVMARRIAVEPELHATLIGGTTGTILLVVWIFVHGIPNLWSIGAALLSIGAGWRAGIAARSKIERQRHRYRASRAIATANTVQGVVDAVGTYFRDTNVCHVSLWTAEQHSKDGGPATIRYLAAWTTPGSTTWPQDTRLRNGEIATLDDIHSEIPYQIHLHDLAADERKIWERLGILHPVLLPLIGPDECCAAILILDWMTERAVKRSIASVQVIAAQVVLALENIRLVEQGRQVGVLEERQRLAREIHDTLAQRFASIVMHLEASEQSITTNLPTALSHLDMARRTARDSLSEARHVVWALRPDVLAHSSVSEAIARVARQWSEESGVVVTTNITGSPRPLVTAIEATLLRAVQEALANVRKHAHASRVMITLSFMDDLVALDVRDDGNGFKPVDHQHNGYYQSGGYGLKAMRERVIECGGNMLVESVPGEGTTLALELPSIQNEQTIASVTV